MSNSLITPGLVLEVAEATSDNVITQEEFSSITTSITVMFAGVAVAVFIGMLMKGIVKEFTEETGIKTKEIAGIPVPIYGY